MSVAYLIQQSLLRFVRDYYFLPRTFGCILGLDHRLDRPNRRPASHALASPLCL